VDFANFEEFMKALDRLHEQSVKLSRSIKKDREMAAGRSRAAGMPAGKELVAWAARLDKDAQKLLRITRAKERVLESRRKAMAGKKSRGASQRRSK
jgi:hypothetical protein